MCTIICLPKHEALRHVLIVKPSNTLIKYKSAIKCLSFKSIPHFFGRTRVAAFISTYATLDWPKNTYGKSVPKEVINYTIVVSCSETQMDYFSGGKSGIQISGHCTFEISWEKEELKLFQIVLLKHNQRSLNYNLAMSLRPWVAPRLTAHC